MTHPGEEYKKVMMSNSQNSDAYILIKNGEPWPQYNLLTYKIFWMEGKTRAFTVLLFRHFNSSTSTSKADSASASDWEAMTRSKQTGVQISAATGPIDLRYPSFASFEANSRRLLFPANVLSEERYKYASLTDAGKNDDSSRDFAKGLLQKKQMRRCNYWRRLYHRQGYPINSFSEI